MQKTQVKDYKKMYDLRRREIVRPPSNFITLRPEGLDEQIKGMRRYQESVKITLTEAARRLNYSYDELPAYMADGILAEAGL